MKNKFIIFLITIVLSISCNKQEPKFAIIETEKEFNFGAIAIGETINHIFKIKNISKKTLKITQVGTSCGCTAAIINDSIADCEEIAILKVRFVADKNKKGKINNSIVIEANTNPPYTVFYLKGSVTN